MATTYTKSLSTDFGSILNTIQFQSEINAEAGIVPTCTHINTDGDDVDIVFASSLTAGEQTTLSTLTTNHTPITNKPGAIYDAIVDASGDGDYLLPSAAFAAGHFSVYVRNGVYFETTDIVIPNYGSLHGESGVKTVIHFSSTASSISCDAGAAKETAGTVSVTTDTTTITGSGTTFTNLSAGDFILLGTNYFKIDSIESDTSMTLSLPYRGATLSGVAYIARAMYTGCNVYNLIVTGSTSHGIHFRGVRHFVIQSVALQLNAPNMLVEYCGDSGIKHVLSESGTGVGVELISCASMNMDVVDIYNNTSHGIEISGTSVSVVLGTCETSNNGGVGICVSGTSKDVNLTDCIVKYNKSSGCVFLSGVSHCMIDSTTIRGNGSKGVSADGVGQVVSGNIVEGNVDIGIDILGSECVVNNNYIESNTHGIKLTGNTNVSNGNNLNSNSLNGIYIVGNDCVVSGNISRANTQSGAEIETGATDTILVYNNLKGNTGTNFVDSGTTSETTGNKT